MQEGLWNIVICGCTLYLKEPDKSYNIEQQPPFGDRKKKEK